MLVDIFPAMDVRDVQLDDRTIEHLQRIEDRNRPKAIVVPVLLNKVLSRYISSILRTLHFARPRIDTLLTRPGTGLWKAHRQFDSRVFYGLNTLFVVHVCIEIVC